MKTLIYTCLLSFLTITGTFGQKSKLRYSLSPGFSLNVAQLEHQTAKELDTQDYLEAINSFSLSFGLEYFLEDHHAFRLILGASYFGYQGSMGYSDPLGFITIEESQASITSFLTELSYKYFVKRRSYFNPYLNVGISSETPLWPWIYSYSSDQGNNDFQNSLAILAGFGFDLWKRADISIEANPYIQYQVIDPYRLLDSRMNLSLGGRILFNFTR
jgi:outer membrane protein W